MKFLGLLVALFVAAFGLTGVVAPDWVMSVGRQLITPRGLYVAGGVRIAIGVILLLCAPGSRAPRTLRVFGIIALIGGLTTPFIGVENARAIVDWETTRPTLLRMGAAFAIALGAFIAIAVATPRREHTHA